MGDSTTEGSLPQNSYIDVDTNKLVFLSCTQIRSPIQDSATRVTVEYRDKLKQTAR
jgi:hypothetical protein